MLVYIRAATTITGRRPVIRLFRKHWPIPMMRWLALGVMMMPCTCPAYAGVGDRSENVNLSVGVGQVDITPTEAVTLAGSPSPKQTSAVDTRLYVKAMVIWAGKQRLAIVTLDTLKYPADLALKARRRIEETSHIPVSNVVICSSHTHSGPLWSYYKDSLITPIGEAVERAVRDLEPCTLGASAGTVKDVSENRRVLRDGEAWNRWQLKTADRDRYPAAGPVDPECIVLAATRQNGQHKAILYSFACHAANTRDAVISADYPGHVQQYINQHLGYDAPTLFLPGACGDVNPNYKENCELFGERLGEVIVNSLRSIECIVEPTIGLEVREVEVPGREHPEFKEREVSLKWPEQLEHYRRAFEEMRQVERPTYTFSFTGIRMGDDFAIVTSPDELFCQIGLSIKKRSPFRHTMVVEQTNGAHGYVPTAKAFEEGGYETWFGEHSYLSPQAGDIVESQSLEILRQLAAARQSRSGPATR